MCASPSYSMCQTLYAVYMGKKYLKLRKNHVKPKHGLDNCKRIFDVFSHCSGQWAVGSFLLFNCETSG